MLLPQGLPEMEHILTIRFHSWLSSLVHDLPEDFSIIWSCVISENQFYKFFGNYGE